MSQQAIPHQFIQNLQQIRILCMYKLEVRGVLRELAPRLRQRDNAVGPRLRGSSIDKIVFLARGELREVD